MDFETVDWEAEAQWVRRAFGIEEPCVFVQNGLHFSFRSIMPTNINGGSAISWGRRDCVVVVNYWEAGRQFRVASEHISMDSDDDVRLTIRCNGTLSERGRGWGDATSEVEVEELARALYHLDLLTPQVEDKLKISITAHQKLEWTLDYEARYKHPYNAVD